MVYPLPRDPWSNNPANGAFFDGRQLHNQTNNPYLNTVFEGINRTQDLIQFAGPNGGGGYGQYASFGGGGYGGGYGGGGYGPPMSANQQFLNNFINPVVGQAGANYRAGLDLAANAQHGGGEGGEEQSGGPISSMWRFTGDILGKIPVVGGLLEGVQDVSADILSTVSFGIL